MKLPDERPEREGSAAHEHSLRRLIGSARDFDPAAHLPLHCMGQRIGWLRPAAAQRLLQWPDIFRRKAAGLHIADTLMTVEARTAAIGKVITALYEEGAIRGWRDERYAVVTDFDAAPLFHIERAAARYLGVTTYAAHANGYCGSGAECEMWIARRSATKPIDPGMLDNLVGGGMSAGILPLQTLVREAWEEAGIPEALARQAVTAGKVRLLRTVPEGVQSEIIFMHDLRVPQDFQPRNQDGEVAGFRRVPMAEVIAMVKSDADITLDASLVMLGFLLRRNYLDMGRAMFAPVLDLNE